MNTGTCSGVFLCSFGGAMRSRTGGSGKAKRSPSRAALERNSLNRRLAERAGGQAASPQRERSVFPLIERSAAGRAQAEPKAEQQGARSRKSSSEHFARVFRRKGKPRQAVGRRKDGGAAEQSGADARRVVRRLRGFPARGQNAGGDLTNLYRNRLQKFFAHAKKFLFAHSRQAVLPLRAAARQGVKKPVRILTGQNRSRHGKAAVLF